MKLDYSNTKYYYINLDNRTDRNTHMIRQFDTFNIKNYTRISAIKENFGAIGCSKSHIIALKKFIDSGDDICFILEDDYKFVIDPEKYNELLQKLENVNYKIETLQKITQKEKEKEKEKKKEKKEEEEEEEEKEEKEKARYDDGEDDDDGVLTDTSGNLVDTSGNNIITFKKYTYKEIEKEINDNYFDEKEYYSSALDILATYLRGQKLIYMESKTYCEIRLNCLMMPSILLSTAATVLASLINEYVWGAYLIAGINGIIAFLLAVVNYLKLDWWTGRCLLFFLF